MNIKKYWHKLTHLGVKEELEDTLQKQIILSNQIALAGAPLILILMMITIFVNQNILRAFIAGLGVVFLISILLFNRYDYTTISRVGISLVLPLVILAVTTFPKIRNTGTIPIVEYFQHRFLFLAVLCLPAILINHRKEKWQFGLSVALSFIFLQILDPLYGWLGVAPMQKYPDLAILKDYFLINIYDSVAWGIIFFSFLFLKEANYKFENVLKRSNQDLHELHREMLAQNEELHQNQEEIKSQRDYIESKNKELNLTNTKLNNSEQVLKKSHQKSQ